ncbi:aminodeoxychorismate synthase component I [Radiobacillus sp. PE A8.2]|uniref:aminodeoxychorismate synthase component I n=1 Tax=Radiobacillus sp. PE A8.2 TaxID=3380349 RepID=UPI00388FC284
MQTTIQWGLLMHPYLLFEFNDVNGKKSPITFTDPVEILQTNELSAIPPFFDQIEQALQNGYYVAGYVSYEAAPAFNHNYKVASHPSLPLVWFGIFKQPSDALPSDHNTSYHVSDWVPTSSYDSYQTGIDQIKQAIAKGDTYQVNYTLRLQANFSGDDFAFYKQLTENQQAAYSAYLNLGKYRLLSASPELFFRINNNHIETKPMKGTAKRGRFFQEDQEIAAALRQSEKERAENVMIVDLLRNDVGRIAKPGTVKVPHLFEIETYPTVHQMTSTITAELQADTTVFDWFSALFPCGSITGAPKISTMEYIASLEAVPREVYCGAIGFITPDREATFSVPIRTVVIDSEKSAAHYGVGGGITWDSSTEGEYQETQVKAQLLSERRTPFALLESLKLEDGEYPLLPYHLARLQTSAIYFGYGYEETSVVARLKELAQDYHQGAYKARLLLHKDGTLVSEAAATKPINQPIMCTLAATPIDAQDPFLFHKTTYRAVYDHFQQQAKQAFSILLWNEQEELTEFTTGNLVVERNGVYYTPPISCGLLAGTYRQALIDQGELHEKVIKKNELASYDTIWFINSVRGWLEVHIY